MSWQIKTKDMSFTAFHIYDEHDVILLSQEKKHMTTSTIHLVL